MTGRDLINYIIKYNLDKETLIPNDMFNTYDDEYLRFTCSDFDADYKVLWLTDNYLQDIIFDNAGNLTYGEFSKEEKEFYTPPSQQKPKNSYDSCDTSERNTIMYQMRKKGYTYQEIADEFGLTNRRVYEIISKKQRQEEMLSDAAPYSDFYKALLKAAEILKCDSNNATRAFNILKRCRLLDSDLSEIPDDSLLRIRNIGVRLLDLIRLADDIYKGIR